MPIQCPTDRYIRIGDINTRYWGAGEQSFSPIILLHGLGAYVETWAANIAALAKYHRVYALDLVGFGRSDKPDVPYSALYLAEFVHQFMLTLQIGSAVLIGHSMGGAVALHLAQSHPARVMALVLVNNAGLGREVTSALRLASLPVIGELLTRPNRQNAERMLREQIFYDPERIPEDLPAINYEMSTLPGAQKTFLKTLRSMICLGVARPGFVNAIAGALGKIKAPVLILWGEQDRVIPVQRAYATAIRMPNATLRIIESCGHAPHQERPPEFNEMVLDYLIDI